MILTDGTNTITTDYEEPTERVIINSNTTVTIGGRPKSQADSERLEITSLMRLTESQFQMLNTIITNYGASITYTPTRKLLYKPSIAAIGVVPTKPFEVTDRPYNGGIIYYVKVTFEEDIGA